MSLEFSKDDEEDWNAIFCARDTEGDEVEPLEEAESDEEGSEISSLLDSEDEDDTGPNLKGKIWPSLSDRS